LPRKHKYQDKLIDEKSQDLKTEFNKEIEISKITQMEVKMELKKLNNSIRTSFAFLSSYPSFLEHFRLKRRLSTAKGL
jgi:IS30 family transposase